MDDREFVGYGELKHLVLLNIIIIVVNIFSAIVNLYVSSGFDINFYLGMISLNIVITIIFKGFYYGN